MAPMTTFSANPDDTASDAEIDYYAARSNGPGMVITACAYVQASGKGFEGQFAADQRFHDTKFTKSGFFYKRKKRKSGIAALSWRTISRTALNSKRGNGQCKQYSSSS